MDPVMTFSYRCDICGKVISKTMALDKWAFAWNTPTTEMEERYADAYVFKPLPELDPPVWRFEGTIKQGYMTEWPIRSLNGFSGFGRGKDACPECYEKLKEMEAVQRAQLAKEVNDMRVDQSDYED